MKGNLIDALYGARCRATGDGCVRVDFDSDEAGFVLRGDFSGESRVTVYLKMTIEGSGRDRKFTLKDKNGKTIDYGFLAGVENRVRYVAETEIDKEGEFVRLIATGCDKKSACFSGLTFSEAEEESKLLGGVRLWQMEGVSLMMGYVFKTGDGKVVVIDGGNDADTDALYGFLRSLSDRVDYWFLTHYHCDHVLSLLRILKEREVKIGKLYYDFPDTATVKRRCPDADAYICDALAAAVKENPDKVDEVLKPKRGDEIKVGDDLTIKVLNDACFDKSANYGNNTCVMYKAVTPGESVLFTGDMGDRGDVLLCDEWFRNEISSCTVIQMAHHGSNGLSDEFYAAIKQKKACLYPAVRWIYDNDNGSGFDSAHLTTLHTRDLVRKWGCIRIYKSADGRKLIE